MNGRMDISTATGADGRIEGKRTAADGWVEGLDGWMDMDGRTDRHAEIRTHDTI
jgi:hypothetical protein